MPAAVAVVGLAIAVGATAAAVASKAGQNSYRGSDFSDTSKYDPNSFNYGAQGAQPGTTTPSAPTGGGMVNMPSVPGAPGMGGPQYVPPGATVPSTGGIAVPGVQGLGAGKGPQGTPGTLSMEDRDRNMYRDLAQGADLREPVRPDYDPQFLANQNDAMGLQRDAAMGKAPSAAEIQMQRGIGQATANQMSMAASARGGGPARALMQRQAMMNSMNAQQQGIGQASQLRAEEMANARGQYGQMTLGMGSQGAQQAQFDAQARLQSRAQNDARSLGFYGMGQGVTDEANRMRMQQQQLLASSHQSADQMNAAINGQNAQAQQGYYQMAAGAGMGMASAGMYGAMANQGGGMGQANAPPANSGGGGSPYDPNHV